MLNPSPPSTDVVVTAVGAVTACGPSPGDLLDAVVGGADPFRTAEVPFVSAPLPAAPGAPPAARRVFAGHVTDGLDLTDLVGARTARALSRESRLLLRAMGSAGAGPGPVAERTGIVLGTLYAGRNEYLAIHGAAGTTGGVNPVWGPQTGYNAPAAQLSIHLGARGPNLTLSSGATAGLDAVVVGARQVADASCDVVVAAGVDTLCPAVAAAAVPADVPEGEAAAVVVLEDARSASGPPWAHVLGTARTTAAAGPGGPAAAALTDAADRAIRAALAGADRFPAEVCFVVTASGGRTDLQRIQLAAVTDLLGDARPVYDASAVTGATGGADGTLAVAVAVAALRRGCVAPHSPEPPGAPLALCLAVDAGGTASAVLLGAAEAAGVRA
ncbi:beta-ketoacyl synthase N-terminal-like domain-containing protein [Streptomyces sp. NPDC006552]|uniref:beta-ketoacyl synthase N-terminal-like domain-containing protein n=1 Tax=Streptomyces sp. NPDC006552 TaxID=3157179 RepID=UPI0033B5956C